MTTYLPDDAARKVEPPTDLPGELAERLKSVAAERQTLEGEIQTRRAALG